MNVWNVELKVPAWLATMVAVLIVALALGAYHYQAVYQATDKALLPTRRCWRSEPALVELAIKFARVRVRRLR